VLGLVSETLETLVDSFLHRVMADEAYSRSAITVDDLRTSSLRTFTALLESLAATNGHDAELERIAIDLGKRRAQQGIALDSLMKAVRLDFSVLWSALCEDSIQADPRLLVAVMVDEPKGEIYGGVVAAPAFQKIAEFALPYLRIPPR